MAKQDVNETVAEETMDAPATPEDVKEKLKGAIDVKVADAGVLRRTVTVTVPRDSLSAEFDKEFDDLISDAVVPGFRKGRAPRRLVEKRYGREVGEQVQTRMLSNAYLAAIEKEDLKVLGDPLVWGSPKAEGEDAGATGEQLMEMTEALEHMRLPEEGDFTFRCEVEIKPEFELPALTGVDVEKPVLTISDDDVTKEIDRFRARRGTWAPVEEGGKVEEDDLIVADLTVTIDGKELAKRENAQFAARPQMVEGAIVSDFGDKVKGSKVGDSVKFEAEMPEDYEFEEHRGKKASFELRIHELKRIKLPPIDKAFLEAQGFDSEDEYRKFVHDRMEEALDEEIRRGQRSQVRKYLLDNTKLELPEGLTSRQSARVAARRMTELLRQGVPQAEIEKHADELKTSAKDQAASELKLFFILEKVAEEFDVDVAEEELNSQIAQMAAMYGKRYDRMRDELSQNNGLVQMYLDLRDEKCIDKILSDAKIVEVTPDKESKGEASKKTTKKVAKKASKKTTKKKTGDS
ncbi:MAG TPA: trigger factor [Phycisphaerae bacterium]|nr:trigger factor [Phycisphaerae bacterium]